MDWLGRRRAAVSRRLRTTYQLVRSTGLNWKKISPELQYEMPTKWDADRERVKAMLES